jgi:hypothetical protein
MQFIRVTKQPPRLFYARRWMTADGDCFAALATTLSRDLAAAVRLGWILTQSDLGTCSLGPMRLAGHTRPYPAKRVQ